MECLTLNSIRNFIGLQWSLKVKDILKDLTFEESDDPSEKNPEKTICSTQCEIKGMNGLNFSLELTNHLNLVAKGQRRWSYQVIYAFAVVKDRAFLVKNCSKLHFLDLLKPNHMDSIEDVTFYSMILVGQPMADPTFSESGLTNNKVLATDGQVCVDEESIGYQQCKFDGEIPDFTFSYTKELITNESTNSVLKVLAMEYLMKNINYGNVTDILQIAVDEDLKPLMKHCSEFLSVCRIYQNRSSSSDSDSNDSG